MTQLQSQTWQQFLRTGPCADPLCWYIINTSGAVLASISALLNLALWIYTVTQRHRRLLLRRQLIHLFAANLLEATFHAFFFEVGALGWYRVFGVQADAVCVWGNSVWQFAVWWASALHVHVMIGVLLASHHSSRGLMALSRTLTLLPLICLLLCLPALVSEYYRAHIPNRDYCALAGGAQSLMSAVNLLAFGLVALGYFLAWRHTHASSPDSVQRYVWSNTQLFLLMFFVGWCLLIVHYLFPTFISSTYGSLLEACRGSLEVFAYMKVVFRWDRFKLLRGKTRNRASSTDSLTVPRRPNRPRRVGSGVASFHVCFDPDCSMSIIESETLEANQRACAATSALMAQRDIAQHFHIGGSFSDLGCPAARENLGAAFTVGGPPRQISLVPRGRGSLDGDDAPTP
eukprot:TRINITY_DN31024_c0_g1_i7.p1 TRINITY_DN31024_c0_g1~~TRINITY_DN31024_c0_g1_i7.p1  ORF type:complete len:402 (-),score=37.48 TRINITY_DN31024_c0_g1_i7:414-1619(-)